MRWLTDAEADLCSDALQVARDSVDAVAATTKARECDVAFLVKKLAAAEQQLYTKKAAALSQTGASLPLHGLQSLQVALLHKAAEAECAAASREAASTVADAAVVTSEGLLVQQLLPALQSTCESFTALHANLCQVRA